MSDLRDRLSEYVLGTLSPEESAEVEARLAEDPELRDELRELDEAAAGLALALEPIEPSPALRERVLASVRSANRFEPFVDAVAALVDVAAGRARELLAMIDDPASWVPGPGPSRLVHFEGGPACAGADTGFVHVPAGAAFPHHAHTGREDTLVLQGAIVDSEGAVFRAGSRIEAAAGTAHAFTAEPGGPDLIFAVVARGVDFAPTS